MRAEEGESREETEIAESAITCALDRIEERGLTLNRAFEKDHS